MHATNRRPFWQKTKQQQVDEKVERLFESYKALDEQRKVSTTTKEENQVLSRKYFPRDDY